MKLRQNIATAKQCFSTGAFIEEQVLALARTTGIPVESAREILLREIHLLVIRACSDLIAEAEGLS